MALSFSEKSNSDVPVFKKGGTLSRQSLCIPIYVSYLYPRATRVQRIFYAMTKKNKDHNTFRDPYIPMDNYFILLKMFNLSQ